jgi:hypothetical protein
MNANHSIGLTRAQTDGQTVIPVWSDPPVRSNVINLNTDKRDSDILKTVVGCSGEYLVDLSSYIHIVFVCKWRVQLENMLSHVSQIFQESGLSFETIPGQ